MGAFDDLIPVSTGPTGKQSQPQDAFAPPAQPSSNNTFADLIPKQPKPYDANDLSTYTTADLSVPGISGDPAYEARQAELKRRNTPPLKLARGYGERAADTASFAASAPVRMLTGGQKGLGDWLRLAGLEKAARSVEGGEQDFAENNPDILEGIDTFGNVVTAGGAFPAGFGSIGHLPSFKQLPLPTGPERPIASERVYTQAQQRAAEAAKDLQSFKDLNVRPYGPAFDYGAGKAVAKQLEETPYIGAPLATAADATLGDIKSAADRLGGNISDVTEPSQAGESIASGMRGAIAQASGDAENIAQSLGSSANPEQAGRAVVGRMGQALGDARDTAQGIAGDLAGPVTDTDVGANVRRGMQRFSTAGINRIEPEVLENVGVETNRGAPTQPAMSEPARQRAAEVEAIRQELGGGTAETRRGVRVDAAEPRTSTRTTAADLSDAELNHLINEPAQNTSFRVRQEALYEHADRQIPDMTRVDQSVNPGLLQATNLRNVARQMAANFASELGGTGVLSDLFLRRVGRNMTFDTLRAIRSAIGEQLRDYNPLQATMSTNQLRALYAAASQDIEVALRDMANRAYQRTQFPSNDPRYLSPEIARQADNALYAMRRADRYTRMGMERIQQFNDIMQTTNPQDAARKLVDASLSGSRGNLRLLQTARAALRPEEWNEIAAHIVNQMGRPSTGANLMEQHAGWSPSAFTKAWEGMDPRARNLLFPNGIQDRLGALVQRSRALDQVAKLYDVSNVEAVYGRMIADAKEGTKGNLARLQNAIATLGPQVTNEVAATLLRQMGKLGTGASDLERIIGWSPDAFLKSYNELSPAARNTLFSGDTQIRLQALVNQSKALTRVREIYGASSFNKMFEMMERDASSSLKGDLDRLQGALAVLPEQARQDVSAAMLAKWGKPVPSARGSVQEIGFSPQTFVTNWNKVSPQAKAMLFSPEHLADIEKLFSITNRVANVDAMRNNSRSATNAMNLTGMAGVLTSLLHGDALTPLGIVGGGYGLSWMMSRPAYARWLVNWARMRANVMSTPINASRSAMNMVNQLGRWAANDSNLVPIYGQILQQVDGRNVQKQ